MTLSNFSLEKNDLKTVTSNNNHQLEVDHPTNKNAISSISKSFIILGTVGKLCGLFPSYDVSCNGTINCRKRRVFDFFYAAIIGTIVGGGIIMCSLCPPTVFQNMKTEQAKAIRRTDFWVLMTVYYMGMFMGLLTMLSLPRKICLFRSYINHFENIDKIFQFGEVTIQQERRYGLLLGMMSVLGFPILTTIFYSMFILELAHVPKRFSDYLLVPVQVCAEMANLTPTLMIVFFMNSIRTRLVEFNSQIQKIVMPITPSFTRCHSYGDYGKEIQGPVCFKRSVYIAEDLEKMRILHEEINTLVNMTSEIFGSHLIRDFLYAILGMILYSYFILFIREDSLKFWYIFPCLDIFIVIKMISISTFAHWITLEGSASLKVLNKASTRNLSAECGFQLQMFMKKLDNPLSITAAGYFTINRKLVTSILGAITTYFVILVQFNLDDKSQEYDCFQICNESLKS